VVAGSSSGELHEMWSKCLQRQHKFCLDLEGMIAGPLVRRFSILRMSPSFLDEVMSTFVERR
jgi:hypothetical protein